MLSFTPLPGFFSPFPHGTGSLSVTQEYLALRDGSRRFTRDFPCPVLLGIRPAPSSFRLQDFHLLWCSIPAASPSLPATLLAVPQPRLAVAKRFRLFPVRSPLLRKSRLFSFPAATKMFQFAAFAPLAYGFS